MPDFDQLIDHLRKRPGMYMDPTTLRVASAWLRGYDTACEGGVLHGFREWLIVRSDGGNNFAWEALVDALVPEHEQHTAAGAERLFALVAEFRSEVHRRGGLRRIFVDYDEWLRAQPWYDPTSQR
ncbi:hypothetical protein ACNOYE_31150 [Nannocystaceae bacterium ST9]